MSAPLRIAPLEHGDLPVLRDLIRGLADFENLVDECTVTEDDLDRTLLGPKAVAEVRIGWLGAEAAGYVLFFPTYSSFLGKSGLWLEDLFVRPAFRRRGVGRELLAWLAGEAARRGCGRLEWSVLDWNENAIAFYRSLGARPVDGWTTYRLAGDDLLRFDR